MKKNVESQLISAQMVSATDGSDVTTGTCNVAVEIDGVVGTGGTATHIANGKWEYAPIQEDTDGDYLTFQFVITGAITPLIQVFTSFPQTVDNDVLAQVTNTVVDTIAVDTTTDIPALIATAQADLDIITGADGAALASSQGDITLGEITLSSTGAGANITLAGSGSGDGLAFTRSGSGELFETSWAAAVESEVNDALVVYDSPTKTEMDAGLALLATEAKQDVIDTNVDAILVDTGTSIPATITTAQNDLDIITGVDGVNLLTATQASIDAVEADTNELQGDDVPTLISSLDAVVDTVKAETALILADTGTTLPATMATIAGYLDTEIAAILVDTGTTIPDLIAGLNNVSTAQVNAEVVDALTIDTYVELAGVPSATSSIVDKLTLLFMLARNKVEQTATTKTLRADDGTTSVGTSTASDDGTTFTDGEIS